MSSCVCVRAHVRLRVRTLRRHEKGGADVLPKCKCTGEKGGGWLMLARVIPAALIGQLTTRAPCLFVRAIYLIYSYVLYE